MKNKAIKLGTIAIIFFVALSSFVVAGQFGNQNGQMYANNNMGPGRRGLQRGGQCAYYNGNGPAGQMGMSRRIDLLNLTEAQQKQFDAIHLESRKKMTSLMLDLEQKQIDLKKEMMASAPNQKNIDKLIDDMAALKGGIMKARTEAHLKTRSILTDDQKAIFDSFPQMGRFNKGNRPYCRFR